MATPIRVAVVTGGHPFDVPSFHALFRGHGDIDAYPQDFEPEFDSQAENEIREGVRLHRTSVGGCCGCG